jgi:predicted glycoside hydrolase/deacetylase ChbG (UPF0249 family)
MSLQTLSCKIPQIVPQVLTSDTTPNTPADRIQALRDPVKEIVTDPKTVAAFAKKRLPLQYATAEEMSALVSSILGGKLSAERIEQIRHVIGEKYYR